MKNNEFKKARIKNLTCYYFDDIIELKDFDFDNILIDKKSHENILIYSILYKNLIGPKPLRIRFDKIYGFIKAYYGTKHLALLSSEKYDAIYNRMRYLICIKSGITDVFSQCYVKIKVDSYDSLPTRKRLTLHNVIILIKSVLNKDKNDY